VSTYLEQYENRNSIENPNVLRWKAVCLSVAVIDSIKLINKKFNNTEFVILKIYNSHIYNILFNIRLFLMFF